MPDYDSIITDNIELFESVIAKLNEKYGENFSKDNPDAVVKLALAIKSRAPAVLKFWKLD